MTSDLPRILFVTGTDTDVGKTIVTAVLAVALAARGRKVAVYKPTQAGTVNGAGDVNIVRQLGGIDDIHEGVRLPAPMAPVAAAEQAGVALPSTDEHSRAIARLSETRDHVLVEGAGGLLVQLDREGHTLADIASDIRSDGAAVVVCRSSLGTLNHTELTVEALERRAIRIAGIVIGSWPRDPGPIEMSNRAYFDAYRLPLLGAVPESAGQLTPTDFRRQAPAWIPIV